MFTALSITRCCLAFSLLMCFAFSTGCDPATTQNTARSTMLNHYESGRYQQAHDAARPNLSRGNRADRDRARYVAGVSAFQLGRQAEAVRYLKPLSSNRDRSLAGRANATLGLVHVHRQQYDQAVAYFKRSVSQLQGEDRAHAYYHLALAEQRLGRWTQARTSLSQAMNNSRDSAFRREVQNRIANTGFTLQLGAFSSRSNADTLARQMRTAASRAGAGSPRVIPSTAADGSRLYLVQVGSFASFESALRMRQKLGRTDVLITVMN
ncbi:MAG: SPOR domain-containing protein [Phycisphaeraceae bacterium]